jgi:hypothetical protein
VDNLEIAANQQAMKSIESWLKLTPENAIKKCPFSNISRSRKRLCRFCDTMFEISTGTLLACPCDLGNPDLVKSIVREFLEFHKQYNQRL